MLEQTRKDVTGFIAEFTDEKMMEAYFLHNHIKPPAQWTRAIDNFVVKIDDGRILELAFWDIETDAQIGEMTFEVPYDYVHCWA